MTSARHQAGSRTLNHADAARRLGRYSDNRTQFWLDLQSQYDIALVERERGEKIARRVHPADAAQAAALYVGVAGDVT